ncbi:RDD family protein [Muriicola marianensis]|uniref:RDD domain-containing protein n=1 Tax=Muriicola marianensis TaxID=1324801 RepID=A0ABQ1R001_9FLAO|nr:RDD family protein [Muriicola marianensis]GGD50425.1 hypothetical protein GCM10011361_16340 [Muriicola marianensis]
MKSQRFLAFFIDLIIINAVIGIFGLLVNNQVSLYKLVTGEASIDIKLSFEIFYYLIYFVFFDIFKEGITVGKKATGLLIIDQNGQIPDRNELVKRTFLKMIGVILMPFAALIYLIGTWAIQDATTDMKVIQGKP